MSRKNSNKKKKRKEQLRKQNANISPSILESQSAATERIAAEAQKEQIVPRPPEPPRSAQEIERDNSMTSFQRYLKSIQDGWKQERATMEQMSTKREKAGYFLYYHKWQVLVAALLVFTVIYGVHAIVTHKDYAFQCVVVNDSYNKTFCAVAEKSIQGAIDYDSKHYTIGVNGYSTDISNYDPGYYGGDSGSQSIFAQMTDCRIDTMIADQDVIAWFAADDNFCNLKDTLPNDLYEALTPYIIQCEDTSGSAFSYALDISGTDLYKDGKSNLTTPAIAIYNTSQHMDNAIAWIRAIFNVE